MNRYARGLARLLALACMVGGTRVAAAADLTLGVALEPGSLDPHLIWSPGNNQLNMQMFGALTSMDAEGRVLPRLATKWEFTEDGDWVFTLDPKARFSTGDAVTTADVIASFERARTLPKGTYRGIFSTVQQFVAVDDHTLKVDTSEPSPTLPAYLAVVPVLPKAIAEKAQSSDFADPKTSVSAGPYQLVQFTPGDRVVMQANPYYVGGKTAWDKLTFRFLTDSASRVAALLSGQVDVIDGVTPDDAAEIRKRGGFNVVTEPTARTVYMTFDISRDVTPQATGPDGKPLPKNPFQDKRVRQALTLAINREAIIQRVLMGQGAPMNQISAPTLGGYNPDIPKLPYDPEKAKALLAEAGYPNGFGLTVTCSSGRLVNDARICQALGQMLERIGLKTVIDVQPYAILVNKATCHCDRRPSFFMSTWSSAVVGETGMALSSVLRTYEKDGAKGVWNLGEYSNPALDKLIDEAAGVMDNDKRFAMQAQAMATAMEDYPVLPMHLQSLTLAARKGLMPTVYVYELTIADSVKVEQ